MDRATLESKSPDSRFAGIFVETYRGYKIRIKRAREWGKLDVWIAGEYGGNPYGVRNADVISAARSARLYIDDSHERPDAYTWSRVMPDL